MLDSGFCVWNHEILRFFLQWTNIFETATIFFIFPCGLLGTYFSGIKSSAGWAVAGLGFLAAILAAVLLCVTGHILLENTDKAVQRSPIENSVMQLAALEVQYHSQRLAYPFRRFPYPFLYTANLIVFVFLAPELGPSFFKSNGARYLTNFNLA